MSKAVDSARKSLNTNLKGGSFKEYNEKKKVLREQVRLRRKQYAYGKFLEHPKMNMKQFKEATGFSEHIAKDTLDYLTDEGLLTCDISNTENFMLEWTIVDARNIPEGWPARGELIMMECPPSMSSGVSKTRRQAPPKTEEEKEESRIINNPLTRMLRKDVHPKEVEGYMLMMKAMSQNFLNDELNDLANAVVAVCQDRIEQKYIECPLCKGRIQRDMFTAQCTNPRCGVAINGGTFEKSMQMLKALAKAGVR